MSICISKDDLSAVIFEHGTKSLVVELVDAFAGLHLFIAIITFLELSFQGSHKGLDFGLVA